MAKRRTGKPIRRPRSNVLEVRVMSPRIAWFGFLRFTGKLAKLALVLAILGGAGYGVWLGIQRAFYKNPDFRLQVIDLNPNPVIDEAGLATVGGLDLTASLFNIDVAKVTEKLKALPAIADVTRVERQLPGKLVVRIVPRAPRAWLGVDGAMVNRKAGALVVDRTGVPYPCPEGQFESAANLPAIVLTTDEEHPVVAGKACDHPQLAHAFRLLDAADESDPEAAQWIDSVRQRNAWSLLLTTRDGIEATVGLSDHDREIRNLRAAVEHAKENNYAIHTINLMPKHNVPVTTRTEAPAPKAVPVATPTAAETRETKRAKDLGKILNRN